MQKVCLDRNILYNNSPITKVGNSFYKHHFKYLRLLLHFLIERAREINFRMFVNIVYFELIDFNVFIHFPSLFACFHPLT